MLHSFDSVLLILRDCIVANSFVNVSVFQRIERVEGHCKVYNVYVCE